MSHDHARHDWSGTARSLWAGERRLDPVALADDADMLMLTGEGDFEGLTLVLAKPNNGDNASRGVIVPTGELLPFPELPAE